MQHTVQNQVIPNRLDGVDIVIVALKMESYIHTFGHSLSEKDRLIVHNEAHSSKQHRSTCLDRHAIKMRAVRCLGAGLLVAAASPLTPTMVRPLTPSLSLALRGPDSSQRIGMYA